MENQQVQKLTMLLSSSSLDGSAALAATAGFFTLGNTFSIAFPMMAGPGALILASLIEGSIIERMLVALLGGIIATILVMVAAGIGPNLLTFLNINILQIVGGLAIMVIGLIVMGVPIPKHSPLFIMILGLIISVLWR
ncbi:hypothetical protein J4410_00585 [Candidatus Woesearchaeota archaeon]|nr:hypothetical protein [Candidatus Woesearchaeota archaeon]